MFVWVSEHTRRYGSPPSEPAIKDSKPDFTWNYVTDPLEFLIDKFIVTVKRRHAQEAAVELARAADDPERGKNIDLEFLQVARDLSTLVPSMQIARFKDMEKRIEQYEKDVKEGRKTGIQFGFPSIDDATGGIQPHEFVTVTGFSGLGKSTLLMKIALNAYHQGHTPLYISLEMGGTEIFRKLDAMTANLDFQSLKHMKLPEKMLKDWRKTAQEIKEKEMDIPIIDSIRGCTPEHVFAETVRHKPDLVIVDYLSLMRSARPARSTSMWQTLTEITQDLKQNARTIGIPIIAAAQTNRSGGKDGAELDNVGLSISVIQDSDIVIGLKADDEMKDRKEMELRLMKNRSGRLGNFAAIWDHENMTFREKTPLDMHGRPGKK